MKRHFQDLFTARIYGIGDGNPASPAAAVHVDAVLLYSMLSLEFAQPHRAWRQIMEHALGADAEAQIHWRFAIGINEAPKEEDRVKDWSY